MYPIHLFTGKGWQVELEKLWKKDLIPQSKPFKILLLTGTHGGKKADGSKNTALSGFTESALLDSEFYVEDQLKAQRMNRCRLLVICYTLTLMIWAFKNFIDF